MTFSFESFTAIWEHRKYAGSPQENHRIGAYFYGSEGVFHMGWRDGWTFTHVRPRNLLFTRNLPLIINRMDTISRYGVDFMDAMDHESNLLVMESSHRSSLPMLGMISTDWEEAFSGQSRETILGDPEALSLMKRSYRTPCLPLGSPRTPSSIESNSMERDRLFEVLFEDESLLVVHKPADLVRHPTKGDIYPV